MKKKDKKIFDKNKKIVLLSSCGIVFLVGIICLISFFYNSNDGTKTNDETNVEHEENIEYTLLDEGMIFSCNAEKQLANTYYNINCQLNFELREKFVNISEINIDFDYDENIHHFKKDTWNLDSLEAETIIKDKNINIKIKEGKLESKYFLTLKFKVDSNNSDRENLNIYLKNIILKDKDGLYYKFKDNVASIKIDIPNYKIDKAEEELVFYKYNELEDSYKEISIYNCEYEECGIFSNYGLNHINYVDGRLLIFDGKEDFEDNKVYYKNIIFYDFEKGTKRKVQNILHVSSGWYDKNSIPDAFAFENINGEMAIIDANGNYIKEFSAKKFSLNCYEGCWFDDYSLENDVIVTIKDGKYGIEKISSDNVVVEHKFEKIQLTDLTSYDETRYSNNKYFKAKENGKYYLYSYGTSEKIIDYGYDNFYIVDEKIIVAYDNKKIYIKDYNGNNLTNDVINIEYGILPTMPKNPEGIIIEKNNNIITISVTDGVKEDKKGGINMIKEYKTYEFNIDTNKLIKK